MALTQTWTLGVKNDSSSTVVADQYIYTGDAESNFNIAVPAGTTGAVVLAVTVANIVSFYVRSDQAVTFNTNSSTTPIQTFALAASIALAWNSGSNPNLGSNPLTTNLTTLYFVNAGATTATVKGGFLLNQ